MLPYLLLTVAGAAIGLLFYLLYDRLHTAPRRSAFRQTERVLRQLEDMFIFISAEALQKTRWVLALALAGIGWFLAWEATPAASILLALLLAFAGYRTPELAIAWLRRRRRAAFSEQLVDGLALMGNGLRSGFTLLQAIDMLIEELPPPISQEFELVRREYRLGVDLDQALRNCVARTRDPDLDLAVTAIQITRQLGGNLAEVFDRIVATVRERKVLAGKAEALTAEGRMQAIVVGLLPYGFMLAMIQVNPDLMRLMWTTLPGFLALLLVIILDVVGYLWVRKLATIQY